INNCTLCPRECKVNRNKDEKGFCTTGKQAWISSFAPHFGEEPMLVGAKGSGTIFFTHCNLKCIFCQNFDISIQGSGEAASEEQIASIMLYLQKLGCHNINFVTPTHVVPQILSALEIAAQNGLNIPLVYNSSGYENVETLKLFDGIIDIYMPDFKFWNSKAAKTACDAKDYPEKAKAAVKEMFRQVGDLKMDKDGVAVKGLLVRHLVMPQGLANTRQIVDFLKNEVSPHTYINIMSQYRPAGDAFKIESLSRSITASEYKAARQMAKDAGLNIVR
ncbi:MAG: radical SAM protein, partial [Desulfobacteraceae bacterium]|nr:radical SAM protein [Desulfobacteraceae bacterium]